MTCPFRGVFDDKTARLGGVEVTEAARTLAGSVARFDFRGVGGDLPQVDLPDLKEFVRGAVQRHGRRVREEDTGLAFLSPPTWIKRDYAVREKYDSLVFDRRLRGADVMKRVLGVGHPVVDTAMSEALDLDVHVAGIVGLASLVLVVSVEDQVTGTGAQANRLIVGLRETRCEREVLPDWQLLKLLNEPGGRGLGTESAPLEAPSDLGSYLDDWMDGVDVVRLGQAAGMQRPVAWPEMLSLPGRAAGR